MSDTEYYVLKHGDYYVGINAGGWPYDVETIGEATGFQTYDEAATRAYDHNNNEVFTEDFRYIPTTIHRVEVIVDPVRRYEQDDIVLINHVTPHESGSKHSTVTFKDRRMSCSECDHG